MITGTGCREYFLHEKTYVVWRQVVLEENGGEQEEHMHLNPETLEAEILGMVAGYVGDDVDVSMPLAAQGLDSLAAIELRQKLQVHKRCSPKNGCTVFIRSPAAAHLLQEGICCIASSCVVWTLLQYGNKHVCSCQ